MSGRFHRGLVVGKFCPLHRGHELLVDEAQKRCDELLIVSYTKPGFPGYGAALRERWLDARFPRATICVLDDERLAALCRRRGVASRPLPFDTEPGDVHRHFVAWLLEEVILKTVDAVFTSEDYGDGFAAVLAARSGRAVEHVCVDPARRALPISGTRIRSNPNAYRGFLSADVYASLIARVALLGGESTGKSTLAEALAATLQTAWAPEYGRELWEARQGQLHPDDMLHIGRTQVAREDALARDANQVLVCDTTPLTTALYSRELFGSVVDELQQLARRPYHVTFLCAPDFAFVQDGTRRDNAFRLRQHQWYVEQLRANGIDYRLLEGSHEERLAVAAAHIRGSLLAAAADLARG
jgi:HTH-type transcriptional repressor of NAD biosynthesis genes